MTCLHVAAFFKDLTVQFYLDENIYQILNSTEVKINIFLIKEL